ncbi:unnamed protein product, partial [marine sediment metagenome]
DTIGTSVYDYISVEYHDEVSRSINGIFESGEPAAYEITGAGPDGTTSWYSVRLGPIKHDGHIIAVTLMALDITERKQVGGALRESEERLRNFMESATDVYTIFNSKLELLDVSEKGTKVFLPTAKREDMIGKHITEIVPDIKKTGRYQDYLNVIKTGKPFQVDDTIVHAKFAVRHVSLKAFKVR